MTKYMACVVSCVLGGLLTAQSSIAEQIPVSVRSHWEAAIAKCVIAAFGESNPFSDWEKIEVDVPGVYSRFDQFEQKQNDIRVVVATRDGLDQCRVLRIGDGNRDGYSESVDRAIFEGILPRQETTIEKTTFTPNGDGIPQACIRGQLYELRTDFVVRTGNAIVRLGPPSSIHGGSKPC